MSLPLSEQAPPAPLVSDGAADIATSFPLSELAPPAPLVAGDAADDIAGWLLSAALVLRAHTGHQRARMPQHAIVESEAATAPRD